MDHDGSVCGSQRSAGAGAGRRRQCAEPDRDAGHHGLAGRVPADQPRARRARRTDAAADPDARLVCSLRRVRHPSRPCRTPADPRRLHDLQCGGAASPAAQPRAFCSSSHGGVIGRAGAVLRRRAAAAALFDPSTDRCGRAHSCRELARRLRAQERRRRRHGAAGLHRHLRRPRLQPHARHRDRRARCIVPDLHAGEVAAPVAAGGAADGLSGRPPAQPGAEGSAGRRHAAVHQPDDDRNGRRSTAVEAILESVMSDTSYTGRDEIWEFALDHIGQRPITGFGFQAFWGTSELVVSGSIRRNPGATAQATRTTATSTSR